MARIVIVGGGLSGLALARALEDRLPFAEVRLLEAADRLGGTIQTREIAGFRIECGPNGFLDSKPGTLALARWVGLEGQLLAASDAAGKNRFLYLRGRLQKLPTGLFSFLFSPVLSWRSRWALLTERFRRTPPPEGEESVAAFARRRVSAEVADTLADAFVSGIYAGDATRLSVQAAFPRLAAFERDHGSVLRGFAAAAKARRNAGGPAGRARMWSFARGLGTLVDAVAASLRTPPLTGVNVRAVVPRVDAPGFRVLGDGSDIWDADRVVLACPAYRQADLLADLDAGLADEIAAIPYNPIAVVALAYASRDLSLPLDGFGYLTPGRDKRDVLGVQWCSSIFPKQRAPDGMVLLRAMCGGAHRPEMVTWPDDRLVAAVRQELAVTMKLAASPAFHHVVRWERAIPQYHLGHVARLTRIDAALARYPGLHLTGNAYRGVAMNDCVEQAELLADRIAADFRMPSPAPSV
jgi:oxygen-dependent protoporphyrinogen oxidase